MVYGVSVGCAQDWGANLILGPCSLRMLQPGGQHLQKSGVSSIKLSIPLLGPHARVS